MTISNDDRPTRERGWLYDGVADTAGQRLAADVVHVAHHQSVEAEIEPIEDLAGTD
jgi:hypothetical protein